MTRTLEQKRADNALARVRELESRRELFRKRYRSYVDRISPTIVMNGLGQALAMELASAGHDPSDEDKKAHKELYESLQAWLCRPDEGVYPGAADLLTAITSQPEERYLLAQAEALAWLAWHKKFCRSFFPRGEEGED